MATAWKEQLGAILIGLLLLALECWLGWQCMICAAKLIRTASKHEQFTRLDPYLPLRGRWLRYVVAGLWVLLGLFLWLLPIAYFFPLFA